MNSIEKQWRVFLEEIIKHGKIHEKDDGDEICESMINHCFIPNVLNQYGNKSISIDMFLEWIKKGLFNIEGYPMKDGALYDYVVSMDKEEIILNKDLDNDDEKFTYTYPNRIFHMTDRNLEGHVNQFGVILERLTQIKINKDTGGCEYWNGSNRAVANIYSATKDFDMDDIPCLQVLQATIRNNDLIIHCFFRSNDCFGAFPANMLFLNYLGLKIVDKLKKYYPNLKFAGISYNSSSLHIYKYDLPNAEKVTGLKRGEHEVVYV